MMTCGMVFIQLISRASSRKSQVRNRVERRADSLGLIFYLIDINFIRDWQTREVVDRGYL